MTVVIMKFGGSCLVDNTAFQKIFDITKIFADVKKVYVASAFNGITDLLLNTAKMLDNPLEVDKNMAIIEKLHMDVIEQIFEEETKYYNKAKDWIDDKLSELEDIFADIKEFGLEPYYIDYVSSFGEILSTYVLNQYLLSRRFDSEFISANEIIITDDNYTNAYPIYNLTIARIKNRVIPLIENPNKDTILCITGFIGRNKIGYITTLGRGGSDYTATILAHSIYEQGIDKDVKVILWKNVDGLLAINPKYVPESSLIKNIDYTEAKEIANFGAKVLHPKCLEALEKNAIPLEIRNFDNPMENVNFTTISSQTDQETIKGISAVENASIITITSGSMVDVPGVLARFFKIMGKNNISVSLVSQSASEISTSFVVKQDEAKKAVDALKSEIVNKEFFKIKSEDVSIINITGSKILENKTKAEIFQVLDEKDIHVKALSQGCEEMNLSLVIAQDNLIDAIRVIHDKLCDVFNGIKCEDEGK